MKMKQRGLKRVAVLAVCFSIVSVSAPAGVFAQAQEKSPQASNPAAELSFREKYKADREKFDREMKLDTARPWDGKDWLPRRSVTPAPAESAK